MKLIQETLPVVVVAVLCALSACTGSPGSEPTKPAPKATVEPPNKPVEAPDKPVEAPDKPVETVDSAPDDTAPVPEGKAIYDRYCLACHGEDGRGNGGLGGNYAKVLPGRDRAELLQSLAQGKQGTTGQMPAFGAVLTDAQRAAVLDYVLATYGSAD